MSSLQSSLSRSVLFFFIMLLHCATYSQENEGLNSLQEQVRSLEQQVQRLQYTELIQSMSQRSILMPNYLAELKALIALQAFNFWSQNEHEIFVSHKNVYAALHEANKYLNYDSARNLFYNQIKGHSDLVASIKFGKDANTFYSASSDGRLLKWDLKASNPAPVTLYEGNVLFRSIDISFDDQWILGTTKHRGIILINTNANLESIQSEIDPSMISYDREPVQAAMFLPGELKYLSVDKSGQIRLKGYGIDSVRAHTAENIRVMTINAKNNDIYAGTRRGVVQIWDEHFEDRYLDLPELYAINALAISPNQRLLAIGREKGDAIVWDMEDKKVIRVISGHQSAITDMDFSPDNRRLVTASRDRTARVWDLNEPKKLPIILDDHNDWVMTACFDQTGSKVLTGSKDNLIRVWPNDPAELAKRICEHVQRDLTPEEWKEYVGTEIDQIPSCIN